MASDGRVSLWDELPDEILLHILDYLEPYSITRLQLVSRRLREFCLDDDLWKRHCFQESAWYSSLKTRRKNTVFFAANVRANGSDSNGIDDDYTPIASSFEDREDDRQKRWREHQDMANWDPSYLNEKIPWYDEYIQRNGPACINWLQMPRMRDGAMETTIEARGMALFNPYGGNDGLGTMLAVSPLDDGSVCLWDVKGTRERQGSIVSRSKPDILFIDGPNGQNTRRSKRIDTGVTECVSVNHAGNKAFFAVQSHLIEVDLERMAVVSRESFEWSITTLSPIHDGVPLTVGTSLGIHLHDFRARVSVTHDLTERIDWDDTDVFKSIFDPKPLPPYASLSQPTPVSILHLPRQGHQDLVSEDIYVAGRFSNILHYDRRKFPAIAGSIYSGGFISSLTSLPYPFSTLDNEVRRQGDLTLEQLDQLKARGNGRTLIAGGAYKNKGSLEMYGLTESSDSRSRSLLQSSVMKNRQTAASSSILSITTHGTKLVFSDGAGLLKWFERDGFTECRRVKIGHSEGGDRTLFPAPSGSGELARKIVSTRSSVVTDRPNNDNVLFWTGERLGMVSFTTAPLYQATDFEVKGTAEEEAEKSERDLYANRMRGVLERQADEIKLMSHFGHGPGLA